MESEGLSLMANMKRTEAEKSTTTTMEHHRSSSFVVETEAPKEKEPSSLSSMKEDITPKKQKEEEEPNEDSDSAEDEDDSEEDEEGAKEKANSSGTFQIPQRFTKSGRKRSVPFPVRLMKVLSDPQFSHIIEWLPSGKSFVIHKPKVFATDVLPTHFKSAKYSSFTRKLHRWGFVRHFRGGESGAFYHADFAKGRLDLAEAMTCCPQQPSSKEAASASKAARKSTSSQQRGHKSMHDTARSLLRRDLRPSPHSHPSFPVLQQPLSYPTTTTSSLGESMMHPQFTSPSSSSLDRISNLSALGGGASSHDPSLLLGGGLRAPLPALQAAVLEQQYLQERLDAAIQGELARLEYSRLAKERLVHQEQLQRSRLLQQQQLAQHLSSGALQVLPSSHSQSLLGSASLAPVLSQLSRAELERYALAMATQQQQQQGGGSSASGNARANLPSYDDTGAASIRNVRPNSFLPP